VAAPGHGEVRQWGQGRLDGVGDLLLLVADGEDVDELLGEADDVGGQVEVGHASIQPAGPPGPRQARATCTSTSAASAYDTAVARVSSAIRASWARAAARVSPGPA